MVIHLMSSSKTYKGTAPYLTQPPAVVEHLKLQEHLGQFVVVLDDLLGIRTLHDGRMLLEDFHWLLDTPEHLPRPRYLTWGCEDSDGH